MAARRAFYGVAALTSVLAGLMALAPTVSAGPVAHTAKVDIQIDGVDHNLLKRADNAASVIHSHIGVSLSRLHVAIGWAKYQKYVPYAKTGVLDEVNGDDFDSYGDVCQIAVNKSWFDTIPHYEQNEVITHEVFHCFENEIAPKETGTWVSEGLARWVDTQLFPHTHLKEALGSLEEYWKTPQRSLFDRSYDAVGFWAHLQDISGALWKRIPDIIRTAAYGSNQAAMGVAMHAAEEDSVLTSWGSSAFDLASGPDPVWHMASPLSRYLPSGYAYPTLHSSATLALAPYSTSELEIGDGGATPLVEIRWTPDVFGTFGVGPDLTADDVTTKLFCAPAGAAGCQCPEGDTGTIPNVEPVPTNPLLGLASNSIGGEVTVTYLSAVQTGYCKPLPPPPEPLLPPRSCLNIFTQALSAGGEVSLELFTIEQEGYENGIFSSGCSIVVRNEGEGEPEPNVKVAFGTLFTGGVIMYKSAAEATAQLHAFLERPLAVRVAAGQEAAMILEPSGEHYGDGKVKECQGYGEVRVYNALAIMEPWSSTNPAICEGGFAEILGQVAGQL